MLFDFEEFSTDKRIRLIELFGGIGSQAMALRDIGADFEHYRLVEFDKYAVKSYNAIHGTNFEVSDIREIHAIDLGIEKRNDFTYLLTYSFPCTDLSIAGKMEGMKRGSGTRSGLLWEVERLLKELDDNLPDVLVMENVPQVHSNKNAEDFSEWVSFLRKEGYSNFYADMNAKDYGVAQNRERCFMVSILGTYDFNFPEEIPLEKVIDDYLEKDVDEKYFISSEKADKLINSLIERKVLPPIANNRTEQNKRAGSQSTCQYASLEKYRGQTVLRQDTTPESVTCSRTELELLPCKMNYRRIEKVGNKCAGTLTARDYKGFGTGFDVQNGVIQIENDKVN